MPGTSAGSGGAAATVGSGSSSSLTVDFHEGGFVSQLNSVNAQRMGQGFWFELSGQQRQQAEGPSGPANPQALNRYSYVLNNPLRYTDPSGHGDVDPSDPWHMRGGGTGGGGGGGGGPVGEEEEQRATSPKTEANRGSSNRTGRSKNDLKPDPNAVGAHSSVKTDANGRVINYETYKPQSNPRDPRPWEFEKRYDGKGEPHLNKSTGQLEMPHVHDPKAPGGSRTPRPDEIPKK